MSTQQTSGLRARPRSSALKISLLLATTAALAPAASAAERLDVLIRGAVVFTGEDGDRGRPRDVGIRDGRIVMVAPPSRRAPPAARTIDAAGLYVAPGFIDPHTHSELDVAAPEPARRAAPFHTMQGVTTIFVGNDGFATPDVVTRVRAAVGQGTGVNVGAFVGFGGVRQAVIGAVARPPSTEELARMRSMVASAMCEGALGLSAGLYYAPQSFAKTDEVVALAREAAVRGGLYDTHMRDESTDNIGLLAAVEEALEIGRLSGAPVHISHIKAQGIDVHGKSADVIRLIERARAKGQNVTADQYTWAASGTRLSNAFVPRWAMDGGEPSMRRRLNDPAEIPRLRPQVADNIRRRGGPTAALITSGPNNGRTLAEVSEEMGLAPPDALIKLVGGGGDASIVSFTMDEKDIFAFARQPWVVSASDASDGHPRKYGTFPHRWRRLVQEAKVLTPADFIRRSTGLTADMYGLKGRGYLRPGYHADVVIFDPATLSERADYKRPRELSTGVQYLLVNGQLAVDGGKPSDRLAGQAILKPPAAAPLCPTQKR